MALNDTVAQIPISTSHFIADFISNIWRAQTCVSKYDEVFFALNPRPIKGPAHISFAKLYAKKREERGNNGINRSKYKN